MGLSMDTCNCISHHDSVDLSLLPTAQQSYQPQLRRMVIGSVLMTDMTQHFQLLEKFSRARSKQPDLNKWEDRDVILQLILHTADISNPFRVPRLATLWGELVTQEFIQQVVPLLLCVVLVFC